MTVLDERDAILSGLPTSLVALLQGNEQEHPDRPALSWRDGDGWTTLSWSGYAGLVRRAALALVAAGVGPGDRVALLAGNRPEHVVLDLAVLTVGGVPVSVYPTLAPEQLTHVLADSGAVLALVDRAGRDRMERARAGAPALRTVVELDDWEAFLASGDGAVPDRAPALDDPATVIYTSGTTGHPKGVVLTQRNVLFLLGALDGVTGFPAGYVNVSYLPLAHVAERIFSHWFGLLRHGHTWFCTDQADLLPTLVAARPEAFLGVPRVWEKLRQGLSAALPVPVDQLPAQARDGVRAQIGLDRCSFAVSGAAPMSVDVLEFWSQLGLPIHEAYGMTETTGVTNMNRPGDTLFGTVGQALPGVEVRLREDGEVVARGPNLMAGYLGQDGESPLDDDGWLATGDLGEISPDGRLRITGRKKELLVTAGGKNVAPVPFEAALREHPLVAHACLVGDRRPYLAALVVLDPEELARRGAAVDDPAVRAELEALVTATNAGFARAEQVKRFAVLARDWGPDSGELTPTLKLRRAAIREAYADVIEGLHDAT